MAGGWRWRVREGDLELAWRWSGHGDGVMEVEVNGGGAILNGAKNQDGCKWPPMGSLYRPLAISLDGCRTV